MLSNNFGQVGQPYPRPYFPLQELRDDEFVQNSPLLRLNDNVLDAIVEYVPLKDRLLQLRSVCHRLSDSVKRSVKSIEFLRDELDYCDDAKIAFFLAVYGKNVEHVNYDLYRSCSLREYTQWSWRQSVISSVTRCAQLKQLDILICCRHRLRDGDLHVIFKQCQQLEVLRMDASYINGHCFAKSPNTLRKIELECCRSFTKQGVLGMCARLPKLQTLHVSLLPCIDEQVIKRIGDMKCLRNLSIVADPEQKMNQFRLAEIRRLPKLSTLCLDGVNNVTDKFLGDLCEAATSPASGSIEHLSFSFCKNIGPNGIAKLKNLPKLKSLNLDGVSKRDISTGLEAIGNVGKLERLMVSEETFVSPRTIVDFVTKCETLRTLDISANHRLKDKGFAEQVYSTRVFSFGKPMVILTDFKSMWRNLPPFSYQSRVEIVNVNDRYPEEFVESISTNTPQQLPRGHLIPDLRRGNRYKMLDFSLDTSGEQLIDPANFDSQDQENQPPSEIGPLSVLSEQEQAELARVLMEIQQPFNAADWINFNECAFARSTVSNFEDSITVGSAGAPGPPREKGSDKILKHSRPSRPKRQAQKERAQQRRSGATNNQKVPVPTGPSFTEDDFPPLG
ncbi:hypothetical protein GCK72_010033 [Caenorhabditis remanei]|uniref:F-box domain-containing protein n=1 Tax=Caenorhabditis remanei TaxID=31234 RepID=A0A6A5H3K1_CAERE|nr:hypothetical protein GCK72_010033 [Caenorhabditis remanei]KAF1761777.1 hypothetical protein GCK72_010033 [Caenorhabditis remanei]